MGSAPPAAAAIGPIIVNPTPVGPHLIAVPRLFELTLRADIVVSRIQARIDRLPNSLR